MVVLLLGSNIGNFDPPESLGLLCRMRTSLGRGSAESKRPVLLRSTKADGYPAHFSSAEKHKPAAPPARYNFPEWRGR